MAAESENGNCNAWAARDPSGVLSPYSFNRRAVQSNDVALKIMYCGVCYGDVGWTRNMMNDSIYPLVPGHEIAGVVTQVGVDVKGFKVGDHVGVGTYVNSCRDCENCNSSLENHCPKRVFTFNGIDTDGTVTKGGYSTHIVVHERYCFQIPDGYPLAKAAPLLCAGITVYTPMMRHNMNQPGKSLGVIGLGGLGHMAVKFGKAFGLKVTVLSTSESKRHEAINLLGADNFVISSDTQQMESLKNSLHFIVHTASGEHPFDPYLSLLKVGGVMVTVCFPSEIKIHPAVLNLGARTLSGSVTGGTKDIQEMVNFCSANKIYPEIEIINIDYINEAFTRLDNRDVKYRFVIDIENSFKHEIAGVVTQVGADVKGFKVGDHVGVGTYVNSCRDCENCNSSLDNHCPKQIFTFNGIDTGGTVTKGGYSTHIVVHERYCFQIPNGYPLAKAAPLLCAGITVYAPMMRHNMNQPGKSLGVIGLGGLGHMAVKFGKAFGLKVTILSTSESKRHEAINLLGADNFVVSSDPQQMESLKNSLHFIVDTASGDHPFDPYLSLLKVGGVMAIVCFPSEIKIHPASLNLGARTLSGSITGGTKDIQEMVNLCGANKIYPEIEIIKIDYINEALTRLVNRDVKYRFVIDIENSFK